MNRFKSWAPHIFAFLIFVSLTVIYNKPLFEGKKLHSHDDIQWKGMAQEIKAYAKENPNEDILWTNSMFGGMPSFFITMGAAQNLNLIIPTFFKWFKFGAIQPIDFILLALIAFYVLLLVLGVSPYLSIMGAIAFAFTSYNFIIIAAGHWAKIQAIAYMPLILAGIILVFKKHYLLGGVMNGIFMACHLIANHFQMTYYYFLLFLSFYFLHEFIKAYQTNTLPHFFKSLGTILLFMGLAVATNANRMLSTSEYVKESTRGKSELTLNKDQQTTGLDKDYITAWSYGIGETMTLFIPNFKGGESGVLANNKLAMKAVDANYKPLMQSVDQYWGDQPFTAGPIYFGAVTIFLFVLGLFIFKGPIKWVLIVSTVLSIMLAWGKNFMPLTEFMIDYMPMYNKFRAVSSILVVAAFSIPLLAILTLQQIFKNKNRPFDHVSLWGKKIDFHKTILLAFLLTGGLALLVYLMPTMFTEVFKTDEIATYTPQLQQAGFSDNQIQAFFDNIEKARLQILKADALRSFFLVLIVAGAMFLFVQRKIKHKLLLTILAVIVLVDLWQIDKRYLNDESFKKTPEVDVPFKKSLADEIILQDPQLYYRVLNLSLSTFNDASTSYFHKSIGGYNAAKLKRYQELIDYQLSKNIEAVIEQLKGETTVDKIDSVLSHQQIINMLNTKYLIMSPNQPPFINKHAFGNAWFVKNYQMVDNADQEIQAIGQTNLKQTAIIDKRFANYLNGFKIQPDSTANIQLTKYAPHKLTFECSASTEQLAVFSDIYYPHGWKIKIDNQPTEMIRANYVLRALKIPAGKHIIQFEFIHDNYSKGNKIALASSVLLLLLVPVAVWLEIKKKRA